MVAALVRWQFALAAGDPFTDAPAERVIGGVSLREGRNVAQLGGPIIPSQCSALQLVLNNHDGYYTFGAGMALGPGSRIRLQWKAVAADAWVTRFVGSLSELFTGTDANPIMITRWLGALYRFTSGNIPGRLIINQTPQSIMTVLSDAAGIPTADRDFDTLATLYNRQLDSGYEGVQQVQAMVDGFIYDAPDGKVRLELPATRAAKAIVARYTDGDPTAAELGVPAPRRLTRPFGIINHVDGEYHYYTPMGTLVNETIELDTITDPHVPNNQIWYEASIVYTFDNPLPPTAAIVSYSLDVFRHPDTLLFTVNSPDDNGYVANTTLRFNVNNLEVALVGNSICATWEYRHAVGSNLSVIHVDMVLTVIFFGGNFEQEIVVFNKAISEQGSISLYGYRPRSSPLVIGIYQAQPLADGFVPDYAELDAAMQADLAAYATPIPVFAVERACDTADHRADILARRLSDKVHLTADGPSMLGADLDAFIEAIQTTIAPTGEITQTLWIEAAPPPVLPEQPSGFTVFRLDNMSLLLFWDNPGDPGITGYRIWRGTSASNINTEIESSVGSASTTQYTDDGLTNNQEYWYQIQALYGALESVRSDSASGIP